MNIVKLRDIIMPSKISISEFFNKTLKGRYAYWIQMRYIFPLDSLSYEDYIEYEQLDEIDFMSDSILPHIDLYSEECCMIDFVNTYIDTCATEEANSIYKYVISNNYNTDADISMDDIRVFRQWLAAELLKLNDDKHNIYSSEQIHMLEYYKNNLYNDVIKYLNVFGNESFNIQSVNTKCGCCNDTNIMKIDALQQCDAKLIYINNMHNFMVKTFEDVDFWKDLNVEFIKTFKKYIDNIINSGLTISAKATSNFAECECTSIKTENNNELILKRLSTSLGYIIDKDINGHINFIHDALYNWAAFLYEKMYWPVSVN